MEQATETKTQLRGVKVMIWTSPTGERRVLPDKFANVKCTGTGYPNKLHAKYAAFKAWADAPYTGPAVDGAATPAAGATTAAQGSDGPDTVASSAATPPADAPAAGQGADSDPAESQHDTRAQERALRIWGGQSPDVPVIERVRRVVNGLKEQGLGLDITLPHEDAGRHLDAYR